MKTPTYARARKLFGTIAVISFGFFVLLFVVLLVSGPFIGNVFSSINSSLNGGPGPSIPPSSNYDTAALAATIALVSSLATAITSFIGFLSTLILGWRKEKREAKLAELERQRLETELEKQRLELEHMRGRKKKG